MPADLYSREIAIQPINLDTYIRHLSFSSALELYKFLAENTPKHIYYSSARYQEPANPVMDEKKWMGSDLVFDIDADEIRQCRNSGKIMIIKFCRKCGYSSNSTEEKTCPKCGSELKKFEHIDVECIDIAREHMRMLIDVLEEDFGFKNITAAFSGHRGFHVVVELDERYRFLTSEERRGIVSYVRLDEQRVRYYADLFDKISKSKRYVALPPRVTDGGLRRRIAFILMNYVDEDTKLYMLGLRSSISFLKARRAYEIFMEHINEILDLASIAIDSKVAIDITHLVRVPNSVNGKTGWRSVYIDNLDVDKFEFSPQELAISDAKIKVKFVIDLPELQVIDTRFSFSKGDEVVLDYPYASYFVFKEVAQALSIVR